MSLQLIPGKRYARHGSAWPVICPKEGKNPFTGQVTRYVMFEWANGSETGMGDWDALERELNTGAVYEQVSSIAVTPADTAAVALSNALTCSLAGMHASMSASDLERVHNHLLRTLGEDLEEQGFVFRPQDER